MSLPDNKTFFLLSLSLPHLSYFGLILECFASDDQLFINALSTAIILLSTVFEVTRMTRITYLYPLCYRYCLKERQLLHGAQK